MRVIRCVILLVAMCGAAGFLLPAALRRCVTRQGDSTTSSGKTNDAAALGEPMHFHCGLVDREQPRKFSVALANNLAVPVVLRGARPSCGCVKVLSLPDQIAPGNVGAIECALDASRSTGRVRQQVVVFTDSDDPARSVYNLIVTASVKSVWVEPATLSFGRVSTSNKPQFAATIFALGHNAIAIKSVACDNQYFRVVSTRGADEARGHNGQWRLDEPQSDFNIMVSIVDSAPIGRLSGTVTATFDTEHGIVAATTFVEAEVIGRVACVPPTLVWAKATPGETLVGEVRLEFPDQEAADVATLALTASNDVSAQIVNSDSGAKVLRVEFKCPMVVKRRVVRGQIIGTRSGEQLFEIPLLAVMRDDLTTKAGYD